MKGVKYLACLREDRGGGFGIIGEEGWSLTCKGGDRGNIVLLCRVGGVRARGDIDTLVSLSKSQNVKLKILLVLQELCKNNHYIRSIRWFRNGRPAPKTTALCFMSDMSATHVLHLNAQLRNLPNTNDCCRGLSIWILKYCEIPWNQFLLVWIPTLPTIHNNVLLSNKQTIWLKPVKPRFYQCIMADNEMVRKSWELRLSFTFVLPLFLSLLMIQTFRSFWLLLNYPQRSPRLHKETRWIKPAETLNKAVSLEKSVIHRHSSGYMGYLSAGSWAELSTWKWTGCKKCILNLFQNVA